MDLNPDIPIVTISNVPNDRKEKKNTEKKEEKSSSIGNYFQSFIVPNSSSSAIQGENARLLNSHNKSANKSSLFQATLATSTSSQTNSQESNSINSSVRAAGVGDNNSNDYGNNGNNAFSLSRIQSFFSSPNSYESIDGNEGSTIHGFIRLNKRGIFISAVLLSLGTLITIILLATGPPSRGSTGTSGADPGDIFSPIHSSRSHGRKGQPITGSSAPASRGKYYGECTAMKNPPAGQRYLQIYNNCDQTIWPALMGQMGASFPPPESLKDSNDSWAFHPGTCETFQIPSHYPSLRVWARTHCNELHQCLTGSCITNGDGSCVSAGETPCSLWEATFQDKCGTDVGQGPDFYDNSLVDGFSLPLSIEVMGGADVKYVDKAYSCKSPEIAPFDFTFCPFELRVYSDMIAGANLPVESIAGKSVETSPCFTSPMKEGCPEKVIGCRSVCKALDQGWIGYYIDHVKGDLDIVDPIVSLPSGDKIRWSEQFYSQGSNTENINTNNGDLSVDLNQDEKCGADGCKGNKAWGGYRHGVYSDASSGGSGNTMKNLVCCDGGFSCSPYQMNINPGCDIHRACPTLGAADPNSKYHKSHFLTDTKWPQMDQDMRWSSSLPDWPVSTINGGNYAELYKRASPEAYSWQYNDASSTYQCCGDSKTGPNYKVTFCPPF